MRRVRWVALCVGLLAVFFVGAYVLRPDVAAASTFGGGSGGACNATQPCNPLSMAAAGAVSGTTGTFSGAVSGTSATFSGTVSGTVLDGGNGLVVTGNSKFNDRLVIDPLDGGVGLTVAVASKICTDGATCNYGISNPSTTSVQLWAGGSGYLTVTSSLAGSINGSLSANQAYTNSTTSTTQWITTTTAAPWWAQSATSAATATSVVPVFRHRATADLDVNDALGTLETADAGIQWKVDGEGDMTAAGSVTATTGVILGTTLAFSATAPTVSSGFGTGAGISGNATSFRLNVGTGGTAQNGVVGLPTAAAGWNCAARDLTNNASFVTDQTSSTTGTATFQNYSRTTGLAIAWTASDILAISCDAN